VILNVRQFLPESFHEKNNLIYAVPGGLIGVGLTIDPFLTRGDRLVGRVCY